MDFYKGIIGLLNPDLFDYVEIGSDSQGTVGVYKNFANQIPRKQQLFIVDDGNAEQIIVCVPSNLDIQDLIDDLA